MPAVINQPLPRAGAKRGGPFAPVPSGAVSNVIGGSGPGSKKVVGPGGGPKKRSREVSMRTAEE